MIVDKTWPPSLRKALWLFKKLEEATEALTQEDRTFLEKAAKKEFEE